METNEKSLIQMARGAFLEIFDAEMAKVIDNILDPNTKATGKRKLNVTFTFSPDDNRQTIGVSYQCKSSLEPINPAVTALYLTGTPGTGEITAVEMVPQIPGQFNMDGHEQESPCTLKIVKVS